MRRLFVLAPLLALGCCRLDDPSPLRIEERIAAVAVARPELVVPCADEEIATQGRTDLAALWQLTLEHDPSLREAAAAVEEARGHHKQAGAYPNPRLLYTQDELGSSLAPAGSLTAQVSQEIVVAGKRRLDRAVAARGVDAAEADLVARKYEALTRVRRAYFDYLTLGEVVQANEAVTASVAENVETTRQLVEVARTRARVDLTRLEALLAQARAAEAQARIHRDAAWRQLAAEVGVPGLPPGETESLPAAVPAWPEDEIDRRVQGGNAELRRAGLEAQQARLEWERARAEATPNVSVSGGFTQNYVEKTSGAVIGLEAPLPIWDRKQGQIHEARARWARAQARRRVTATRLARETADAFGRYEGARRQVERMTADVLPRLEDSLKLLREGYQKGTVAFADLQLGVETLNDARLKTADARRELWRAIADLQGLMQLDLDE